MRRRSMVAVMFAVLLLACTGPSGRTSAPGEDASEPVAAATAPPAPGSRDRSEAVAPPQPTGNPTTPDRPPGPLALRLADVERARSPRRLAELLVAAERAARDASVTGAPLANAAHVQQRAYRRLSSKPGWRAKVLRFVPPPLQPAVRNNTSAGTSLTALVTPQRELPDWRIIPPPPARTLLRAYRAAAKEFGMRWQYLAAINLVETRMGRIRGRSTAGAQGPMQFMPATWDAYGRGDINNPQDAIAAAARYLAAHGAPGDMDRALWHYNHSDRYVEAVSAYARVMIEDPNAFRGYYHWQVYYTMPGGAVHLPVGYGR